MYKFNVFIGVILAIVFICVVTFFVIHKTKDLIAQEKILFVLIFLITILATVFVVDKIIAFNISLLNKEESDSIFEIIRSTIAIVLGYYFGSKKPEEKNN